MNVDIGRKNLSNTAITQDWPTFGARRLGPSAIWNLDKLVWIEEGKS